MLKIFFKPLHYFVEAKLFRFGSLKNGLIRIKFDNVSIVSQLLNRICRIIDRMDTFLKAFGPGNRMIRLVNEIYLFLIKTYCPSM